MESGLGSVPPALIPFFWAPGWNSVQATNKFQSEVGGPLRGGDPGVCLIEPFLSSLLAGWHYFSSVPAPFTPRPGEWLVVPIVHIFESEELSRHAPSLAQLTPRPSVALHPMEASLLAVSVGEPIRVAIAGLTFDLPTTVREDLPRGVVGLPAGLLQAGGIIPPAFCTLAPILAESSRGAP
jgi:NADH-quinone oxidoreductase subunit G